MLQISTTKQDVTEQTSAIVILKEWFQFSILYSNKMSYRIEIILRYVIRKMDILCAYSQELA